MYTHEREQIYANLNSFHIYSHQNNQINKKQIPTPLPPKKRKKTTPPLPQENKNLSVWEKAQSSGV